MANYNYKTVINDYVTRTIPEFVTKTYVEDVAAVLQRIGQQYQEKEDQLKKAREQLQNFKAQAYKDKELAKMKIAYDRMEEDYYRGFAMTEDQATRVYKWIKKHENEQHGGYPAYHGVSGGGYTYEFVPTAIGVAQSCVCNSCRYKAWSESKGNRDKYEELIKKYDGIFDFTEDW